MGSYFIQKYNYSRNIKQQKLKKDFIWFVGNEKF